MRVIAVHAASVVGGEMVINMRTAKTLALAVPQSILIAADELMEWDLRACSILCP
jgi:hypothetical protein